MSVKVIPNPYTTADRTLLDKIETEIINESDALDMEINYMYYDKNGGNDDIIIVFEV